MASLVDHFEIVFDKQFYCAGEQIGGRVEIRAKKPIPFKSIVVHLVGTSQSKFVLPSNHVVYKGFEHIVQQKTHVGNAPSDQFPSGDLTLKPNDLYSLKFQFNLPQKSPQTLHIEHYQANADVTYQCSVEIERRHKKSLRASKELRVSPSLDLTRFSSMAQPFINHSAQGLISKQPDRHQRPGTVEISIFLDKTGFVPGESIVVKYRVVNHAHNPSLTLTKLIAELQQICTFEGKNWFHGEQSHTSITIVSSKDRSLSLTPGEETAAFNTAIDLPESMSCDNTRPLTMTQSHGVSIQYQLVLRIENDQKNLKPCEWVVPIKLGTSRAQPPPPQRKPEMMCRSCSRLTLLMSRPDLQEARREKIQQADVIYRTGTMDSRTSRNRSSGVGAILDNDSRYNSLRRHTTQQPAGGYQRQDKENRQYNTIASIAASKAGSVASKGGSRSGTPTANMMGFSVPTLPPPAPALQQSTTLESEQRMNGTNQYNDYSTLTKSIKGEEMNGGAKQQHQEPPVVAVGHRYQAFPHDHKDDNGSSEGFREYFMKVNADNSITYSEIGQTRDEYHYKL